MRIKKYMLVDVWNNEINTPKFFDTYEEAYEVMKKDFWSILDEDLLKEQIKDGYAGFGKYWAFYNGTYESGSWQIFDMEDF